MFLIDYIIPPNAGDVKEVLCGVQDILYSF